MKAATVPVLRARLVLPAAAAVLFIAVEAFLVAPAHLLAAQIVDALLVAALVNAGAPDEDTLAATRALALVPLIRVMSLAVPIHGTVAAVGVLLVAVPIAATAVYLAPLLQIDRDALVRPDLSRAQAPAVGAGFVLSLVVFCAGGAPLWDRGEASGAALLAVVAAVIGAAASEIVFRGVLQPTFERAAGRPGLLAAAALFAATYLWAAPAAAAVAYALAGLAFAVSVSDTRRLGGAIAGHMVLAVFAGAVWPAVFDRTAPVDLDGAGAAVVLGLVLAGAAVWVSRRPR